MMRDESSYEARAFWMPDNFQTFVPPGLLEDEVSHSGFDIPVDDRERRQVEGRVHGHHHPQSAGYGEERPKNESGDRGLFEASESLLTVVVQGKQPGAQDHARRLGGYAASEKLTQALEQVSPKDGLFSEAPADNHQVHGSREGGRVAGQVMVRLIDRRGTEQRHDERFHQELEYDAQHEAEGQVLSPALGLDVADLAPRRARPADPPERQQGAQGRNGIIAGEENDEQREDTEGPESAQRRRDPIAERRCGSGLDRVLRMLFRQRLAPVPSALRNRMHLGWIDDDGSPVRSERPFRQRAFHDH